MLDARKNIGVVAVILTGMSHATKILGPARKNLTMAEDCWCSFKFHLPGEKKRHLDAAKRARRLVGLAEKADSRKEAK